MTRTPLSRIAVGITIALLALAGCGDSNLFEGQSSSSGTQSELEAGLQALDSGNWSEAQRIFLGLDQNDPDVRKYLASAYVGEAGFDVLTLVEQIDAAQTNNTSGDIIYSSVTSIFDDGTGTLTQAEIDARVDLVLDALTALGAFDPALPRAARTAGAVTLETILVPNQFQAGLYSALYAVLAVVQQLAADGDILLTLEALQNADACTIVGGVVVPPGFDQFLHLVRLAVQAIEPGYMGTQFDNDIAIELDQFLTEIGYLPGESVSTAELRSYLYGLLDITCTP